MRLLLTAIPALLLAMSLDLPHAYAQSNAEERDIIAKYDNGQTHGMQIKILLKDQHGAFVPVAPERAFRQGEVVKFSCESNFGGYVYIINLGSSGRKAVLFPKGGESNLLKPRQPYVLPRSYELAFAGPPGLEVVRVLAARRPVHLLEAAIKRRQGELDDAAYLAIAKFWEPDNNNQPAGIIAGNSAANARQRAAVATRDPIFSAPKKATLITIRRQRGRRDQLGPADVLPFSINLRNLGAENQP